jgi:hypothetical protein
MRTIPGCLALIVALLTGCAGPDAFRPSRLALLNLGMTKEEVLQRLGPPQQAATANDGVEAFRYAGRPRGAATTNAAYYGVIFRNGQVVDYGPESGIRPGGHHALREVFTDSWQPNPTLQTTIQP